MDVFGCPKLARARFASKDFLVKAPPVDDKKYDSLYARDSTKPVFAYWHVIWLP
jgi:hypothetical protein